MSLIRIQVHRTLNLFALVGVLVLAEPALADEYAEVNTLLSAGRSSEALSKTDQLLASRPRDPQLRFLRGVILAESGRSAEAVNVFVKLTEDYPELPEPYNNLAVQYANQNQFEKSRVTLEMAIRTNPSYATAHENLGDIYARLASQAYSRALQLDSGNATIQPKLTLIRELFSFGRAARPTLAAAATAPVTLAAPAASVAPAEVAVASPAPPVTPVPPAPPEPTAPPAPPAPPVPAAPPAPPAPPVPPVPPVPPAPPAPPETPSVPTVPPLLPAAAKPAPTPAENPEAPVAQGAPKGLPAELAPVAQATPAVTTAMSSESGVREVESAVQAWAAAWSSKNMTKYLGAYGEGFAPPGRQSRKAWEEERRLRIVGKARISVKVSELQIKVDGDRAVANFRQAYKADNQSVSSRKQLFFQKVGPRWLIIKEVSGS